MTRAVEFTSLSEGLDFVRQILETFLLGFAIATGVPLLILPITSRGNVFLDVENYADAIRLVLDAQISYLRGGETNVGQDSTLPSSMNNLRGLHEKLHTDLVYSKHEIVWGKLSSSDQEFMFALLRSILMPLAGLSMLPEILKKLTRKSGGAHNRQANRNEREGYHEDLDGSQYERWQPLMRPVCARLESSSELVAAGLRHALIRHELI
jgi:hypothetical protein